jgi:competence CoiA-like predicted nuclease
MLMALDAEMQRRKIFAINEAKAPFFCQICGEEVEPAKTPEGAPYWKHKENPCRQWEPETSEHLKMKNALFNLIPTRLKPQLEAVIADTISDIFIPELKINIECQVAPQTMQNVKKRLWKMTRLGYFTLWIWYQGDYAKITELGKQQTYYKLNTRLVENLILSQFFTEEEQRASSKAFWEDYETAAQTETSPRYFTFYGKGKFQWLSVIRRYGKRFYSGALRDFDFADISVELYKTDIGRLAAFIKGQRTNAQQQLEEPLW